jgi:hypothetical protein
VTTDDGDGAGRVLELVVKTRKESGFSMWLSPTPTTDIDSRIPDDGRRGTGDRRRERIEFSSGSENPQLRRVLDVGTPTPTPTPGSGDG